ncbi:hypothetical protein PM082_004056 [Marasmius tenuissimus]|nr:hypothetical protein PM082_004056 [Marasmius tenuissimus]
MQTCLPLELVDCILKECGLKTLQVCSLVCKSWLPLCRPRLFEIVEIDMTGSDSPERCRELVMMESVVAYIRRMALIHSLEDSDEEGEEDSENKENENILRIGSIMRDLSQLKDRLKSLQALIIMSDHGSRCLLCNESPVEFLKPLRRYPTIPPLLSTFVDVVELSLDMYSEDLESFVTFICSFPQLRDLRIKISNLATYGQQFSLPTCVLPLALRSLHLDASDGDGGFNLGLHQWVSTHPPRQIVLFSITNFFDQWRQFTPSVEPYFTGLCKETTSLHLSFDIRTIEIQASSVPHNLNLLQFLERIIFSLYGIDTYSLSSTAPIMLSKLLQILSTITSTYFRTVVFHLRVNPFPRSLTESQKLLAMLSLRNEWNRIDDLLSTEKFATCAVELVVTSSISGDDLITSGRKAFPKANDTGRFSVIRAPFEAMDEFSAKSYEPGVKEEMEWVRNRRY